MRRPTVGEEYCDIVPLHSGAPASSKRRLSLLLLHLGAPYLLRSLIERFRRGSNPETPGEHKWLDRLEGLVSWISRAHMAVFYLTGRFYHPAYRLTGIGYSYTREMQSDRPPYAVLGVLVTIQLVGQALSSLYGGLVDVLRSGKDTALVVAPEEEEEEPLSGQKCVLCMEDRVNDTATECGHIFCWHCIFDWCVEKAECPLCRASVDTTKLIRLRHYAG